MGYRTNTTNRQAGRNTDGVVEVSTMADFPAPSGGVITLNGATQFIFRNTLVTADRFVIGDGATIEFLGTSFLTQNLVYVGGDTLFSNTGAGVGRFYIRDLSILLAVPGSQAFDLLGDGGPTAEVTLDFIDLIWLSGSGNIGLLKNFAVLFIDKALHIGVKTGLIGEDVSSFNWQINQIIADTPIIGKAMLNILGKGSISGGIVQTSFIGGGPGDAGIFIDPIIGGQGSYRIQKARVDPPADFFALGTIGAITAFADASVASTVIVSVTDSGGIARFNFLVGPTLFVGQEVTISGFIVNTAYNITGIITATGAGFFEISSIAFGSDEIVGSFLGDSVTVTSATHGQSDLQNLLIDKTLNYNDGFTIFNALTNTFQINHPFDGDDATGIFNTGSLTETDKRMDNFDNGPQKDSMVAGGWDLTGNVAVTTVVNGVFNDINFGGILNPLTFNERLILVNTTNGIVRYTAQNPSVIKVPIEMLISPTAASDRTYGFKLVTSTDGGATFVDLPDVIETTIGVKSTDTLLTTFRSVLASPEDEFKWVQKGVGTTLSFTALQGCVSV